MRRKYKFYDSNVLRIPIDSNRNLCDNCMFNTRTEKMIQAKFKNSAYELCYNVWKGISCIPSCSSVTGLGYYVLGKSDITKIEII